MGKFIFTMPDDAGFSLLNTRMQYTRMQFAQEYCKQQGWDIENLSFEQVFEIRKRPEWKDGIIKADPLSNVFLTGEI